MQPQGHVQVVVALADDRARPAGRAGPAALLHRGVGRRSGTARGQQVALEEGIPAATVAALAAMGHPVEP